MRIIAIIPARLESSRLSKKVLQPIGKHPMIYHTYRNAKESNLFTEVVVACDDELIVNTCQQLEIPCMLTSKSHQSGTDRVAEAAQTVEADFIVNLQADEPFIHVESLQKLIKACATDQYNIITLRKQIESSKELLDFHTVKVVSDNESNALYFSRTAIPAQRQGKFSTWLEKHDYYKHIGVYAFRKTILQKLANLPEGKLEATERLEQLRWLENGYKIHVPITKKESIGVDTPEDLEAAIEYFTNRNRQT